MPDHLMHNCVADFLSYMTGRIAARILEEDAEPCAPRRKNMPLLKLLCMYMDMWWNVLSEAEQCKHTDELSDDWWKQHFPMLDRHVPRLDAMDPHATHVVWEDMQFLFFHPLKMSPPEETAQPILSILRKAFPQKYQPDHFVKKVRTVIDQARKYGTHTQIEAWIVECSVAFFLGLYDGCRTVCTDFDLRRAQCWLWRNRLQMQDVVAKAFFEENITSLYMIKLYLVHAVAQHTVLHDWTVRNSVWADFEAQVYDITDQYRLHHDADKCGMRQYLKAMPSVYNSIVQPAVAWDFIRTVFKPAEQIPDAQWYTAFRKTVRDHLTNQYYLASFPHERTYAGTWRNFVREEYFHEFSTRAAMLTSILHGMCSEQDVQLVEALLAVYFSTYRGNLVADRIKKSASPRLMFLMRCFTRIWAEWNSVWMLPTDYRTACMQVSAIRGRFTHKDQDKDRTTAKTTCSVPPNCDWFLACPNCGDIQSMVAYKMDKARRRYRNYPSNCLNGFEQVIFDIETGRIYCGRKDGKLKTTCATTELDAYHITGRIMCYHGQMFTICPQRNCGNIMHLTSDHAHINQRGWACAFCMRAEEHERSVDTNVTRFRNMVEKDAKDVKDEIHTNSVLSKISKSKRVISKVDEFRRRRKRKTTAQILTLLRIGNRGTKKRRKK
jgi:hypothetical protein